MNDSEGVGSTPRPPSKRPHSPEPSSTTNGKKPALEDLSLKFNPKLLKFVKVLKNDAKIKSLVLHCSLEDKDAIVIVNKTPFPEEREQLVSAGLTDQEEADTFQAESLQSNDVYNTLLVQAGLEKLNHINMTVIYPAQENHFKRYISSGRQMIHESPSDFQQVTVPFLNKSPKDLAWVDNILEGRAEIDRVILQKDEYTLVLDYRWNLKHLNEMHALGLVKDPALWCLRELRGSHVAMLEEMLDCGRRALAQKFSDQGLLERDVVAYFHYPPTFYRLHMHFVHVNCPDDATTRAGRAHLADEVIRNLKMDSLYYAERTMTIFLGTQSPMLQALVSAQQAPSAHGDSAS
ncbi:hypothetical protein Ciccas_012950 [Cichlidogyrus casuarinus]|uniref:m7GpppX diphosphatase n=1 Tax=Cichlidogyrus casuarinus TaxID=1844966 RepID=A0ABD2PM00_9PLAT